jgi:hypothetical protein
MKVIGITTLLRGEADQKCGSGFRAWIMEAKRGTWGNWAELLLRYPEARLTGADEAHFPLAADGTGIRTMIFFNPGLMRLLRIAPAPIAPAAAARRTVPLSHSYSQPQPRDISKTL